MVVLVTGAGGQLGQCIKAVARQDQALQIIYATSAEADITDNAAIRKIFKTHQPAYCINAAAYTAVDKAESEPEEAEKINADGAKNIAEACREFNTVLIHISTDFVFDGLKKTPYTEQDPENPRSIYGKTKLDGELAIKATWPNHIIIRTSWLYSRFGHNFMKTMLRLAGERESLGVVSDQVGNPTSAMDLARAILTIIGSGKCIFGTFHFSNEGIASWYDFAKAIFRLSGVDVTVNPITTAQYPTPAERPPYSALDKSKIAGAYGLHIRNWEEALAEIVEQGAIKY